MPHATAEDPNSAAALGKRGNPPSYTYLGLLECNGQSNFPHTRFAYQGSLFNISPGKFDLPFTEHGDRVEYSLDTHGDLDFLHAPFFMPSQGKQAWASSWGAIGPMAEWLIHLGSQFDGEL
jgi:hypothetical protein